MMERSGASVGVASIVLLVLGAALLPLSLSAQYFGKNKVQYEDHDFKTYRPPLPDPQLSPG